MGRLRCKGALRDNVRLERPSPHWQIPTHHLERQDVKRPGSASLMAALGIAALVTNGAQAQAPDTRNLMKGKIKPGLYEEKITLERIGLGLPPDQVKTTETKTECVTAEDIESGEFRMDDSCVIKSVQRTSTGAQITASCKAGGMTEISLAAHAGGYRVDMKSTGKGPDGKPFAVVMRSESKYVGACKD